MNRLLLILSFFLVGWTGLTAQTTIEGKVKDKESNEPILFGSVALYRGGVLITGTETDFDGNYTIADVQPGTYDMEASYVGYNPQRITGIVISAGRTNRVNFDMSTDAVLMETVEIIEYKVPLIEIDNTTQGTTVTAEKIRSLPTKQINAIAATAAGISSRDGGDISIRGSRSNETVYFLDGVRVTGDMIPQSEIEQLQVVVGGVEARYGDVSGGIISLTSRGPSSKVMGTVEYERGIDGFGHNLLSANVAGPLLKDKKGQPIIGYRLSGQYITIDESRPSAVGYYRAPEALIRQLEANPTYTIGNTEFPSMELLRNSDIGGPINVRPNNGRKDIDLTARLDFKLSDQISLQLSGNYKDVENRFTPNSSGVSGSTAQWGFLNWVNNPFEYSDQLRGNLRFTHKIGSQGQGSDGEKAASNFRNLYYTLTLGYEKRNRSQEDFRHQDRLFNYGYFGETDRTWVPAFGFSDNPEAGGPPIFGHVGFRQEVGEFRRNDVINPILGSYNAIQGVNVNGLLNQNNNAAWNNLFANVGQVYNQFFKSERDIYTLNLTSGFDLLPGGSEKGRHNITFGLIYEQSINRSYNLNPFGLWNLADIQANGHINGIDTSVIIGEMNGLPIYQTAISLRADDRFYRSARELKGLSDYEYLNVWDIDPSLLRLDMFSASELVEFSQNIIGFDGYDYLGNRVGSDVRFDDFFTSRDADGKRNFLVAPQQPIYGAFFLQDKFSYKDIIFRLGLRVDYFDANTKVLRDPYALNEIETAKDYYTRLNLQQPSSVGDDYKVYVVNGESDEIRAFRSGDQWFLPNGTAVSNGQVIYQGGLVFPSYAGKDATGTQRRILDIRNPDYDPNNAFVDYKPQINFMPRLAFSFPISDDAGFFAHYDVLYMRPQGNAFASALDYYFFEDITRFNPGGAPIGNPNLRPVRTVDYEAGFQQKLSDNMAIKMSAFYKEAKDLIQSRVFANVAAPLNEYETFDNLDFSTIKGFNFEIDRRRINNLELRLTYALQFADGSGSDANSSRGINARGPIRNLLPLSIDERHRFTGVVDYRFGEGRSYNGPDWKLGNVKILENFGVNFLAFLVSGQPYTRRINPSQFGGTGFAGSINGARLPWNFIADMNITKRHPIMVNKETNKRMFLNIVLRVQNVFNIQNTVGVYSFSGDPNNDGFLETSFGRDRVRGIVNSGRNADAFLEAYQWRMLQGGFFNIPRRMFLGIILDF